MTSPVDIFFQRILSIKQRGAPLFKYRVTDEEYTHLVGWLKMMFRTEFTRLQDNQFYKGLLVLYASEWFRRRYAGGQLGYGQLLSEIDVDYTEIGYLKLQEILIEGFNFWQIPLSNRTGRRYISTVVANSGMPVHLISSDRNGNLVGLLSKIIQKHLQSDLNSILIRAEIINRSYLIPAPYRQEFVIDLFEDLCMCTINLIKESRINLPTDDNTIQNPLEALERNNPSWRDELPIYIDPSQSESFLNALVLKSRPEKREQSQRIDIEVHIVNFDDTPSLTLKVKLPKKISFIELKDLFLLESDEPYYSLTFDYGNESHKVLLNAISGIQSYLPSKTEVNFERIDLKSNGNVVHARIMLGNGVVRTCRFMPAIDRESPDPWIFAHDEDSSSLVSSIRRHPSDKIVVAVDEATIPINYDDVLRHDKRIEERVLYTISRDTLFDDPINGSKYMIRVGANKINEFSWNIDEVENLSVQGYTVIRGIPRAPMNNIAISKSDQNSPIGLGKWFAKRGDITLSTRKYCVIPQEASIVWENSIESGLILVLRAWEISDITPIESRYSNSRVKIEESRSKVIIIDHSPHLPVDIIRLRIQFRQNPVSVDLAIPIPTPNGQWIKSDGRLHQYREVLTIQDLYGMRFYIQKHSDGDQIYLNSQYVKKTYSVDSRIKIDKRVEVRPVDYLDDIQNALSYSNEVNLSYLPKGIQRQGIIIQSYSHNIKIETNEIGCKLQLRSYLNDSISDENWTINLYPLNRLDDIRIMHSSGIDGEIDIHNHILDSNRWLILPEEDRKSMFEPIFFNKNKMPIAETKPKFLSEMMVIEDSSQREEYISNRINKIAEQEVEYDESYQIDYAYIKQFMTVISGYKINRDPILRGLALQPKLQALLSLDFTHDQLAREFMSSPLADEMFVSHQDWIWALNHPLLEIHGLDEETQKKFILHKIKNKMILTSVPIAYSLNTLNYPIGNDIKNTISLPVETLKGLIQDEFDSMRNRTADRTTWPNISNELSMITQKYQDSIHPLCSFQSLPNGWFRFVTLPMAIAIACAKNELPKTILTKSNIKDARDVRTVDQIWFDQVYKYTYLIYT